MAKGLGIDVGYIEAIAMQNNLYVKYYIKKKNGGKREILQPSKGLKVLQKWLLRNILNEFPISEYSYAYRKGDSVVKNADRHKNSKYLLHTDIINFFPSITRRMLIYYFVKNINIVRKLELTKDDIRFVLDVCLYKGKYLVVGSVASPTIANMVMYEFDNQLMNKLDEKGRFYYTRYADDIIVSSEKYINDDIINLIEDMMKKYDFNINRKKTYYMNKKCRRQVTGVVIDNNTNILTIGNRKYKLFERTLYKYLIKGDGDLEYIKGYLAYIKGVNNDQYDQLRKIYIKYDKDRKIF